MKEALAASGPLLLPERRKTRSTVLQDLGPVSSLSRIESSHHSDQTRLGSLRNALLFLFLWKTKTMIP